MSKKVAIFHYPWDSMQVASFQSPQFLAAESRLREFVFIVSQSAHERAVRLWFCQNLRLFVFTGVTIIIHCFA